MCDSPQPQHQEEDATTQRLRNMRKRYSNLATAATMAAQAKQAAEHNGRKSFALDMAKIPSFTDGGFFEDATTTRTAKKRSSERSRRERRHSHSQSKTTTNRRRRRSCEGRTSLSSGSKDKSKRESRRFSLQIPETKVVVQPVSSLDDVLFKDESHRSSRTTTTATESLSSNISNDSADNAGDPFSPLSSCEFQMSFDSVSDAIEDAFAVLNGLDVTASATAPYKYTRGSGSSRMHRSLPTTPEDVSIFSSPRENRENNSSRATRTRTIALSSHARSSIPVSSHSRTTGTTPVSHHSRTTTHHNVNPNNEHSRRPRRRSSLGDVTPSHQDSHSVVHKRDSALVHKSDANSMVHKRDSTLVHKSDYHSKFGGHLSMTSPHQWSLKKIVSISSQHRRSSHSRRNEPRFQELLGDE